MIYLTQSTANKCNHRLEVSGLPQFSGIEELRVTVCNKYAKFRTLAVEGVAQTISWLTLIHYSPARLWRTELFNMLSPVDTICNPGRKALL
jgi:hypothetical protein